MNRWTLHYSREQVELWQSLYEKILIFCLQEFFFSHRFKIEKEIIDWLWRKLRFFKNFVWVTRFLVTATLFGEAGNACNATKLNIESLFIVISFFSLIYFASYSQITLMLFDILSFSQVFFYFILVFPFSFCFELSWVFLPVSTCLSYVSSFFLFRFLFSMLISAINLSGLEFYCDQDKSG